VRVGDLGGLGHLYAGLAMQAGNTWDNADDVGLGDLVYSGTLFFGVDNRLTPVYVGYGQAEGGEGEFYLFVGRPF
jgi:NTE family protein